MHAKSSAITPICRGGMKQWLRDLAESRMSVEEGKNGSKNKFETNYSLSISIAIFLIRNNATTNIVVHKNSLIHSSPFV